MSRKKKCEQILGSLQLDLDPNHKFGQAWARAKSEYLIALEADHQARMVRKANTKIGNPPLRLLKAKTRRAVTRSQLETNPQTVRGVGGFELDIQIAPRPGKNTEPPRYRLRWQEDDGQSWSLEPVLLPVNTVSDDATDERFIF